jgi:hypothetical protein
MSVAETKCRCCGGTGRVEGATGAERPCSRCSHMEFRRWADARRPKAPPAMILPVKPGGDVA